MDSKRRARADDARCAAADCNTNHFDTDGDATPAFRCSRIALIIFASLGDPSPTASASICWAPCSLSAHRLAFHRRRPPRASARHHAHYLCFAWRSIADGLHEQLRGTMLFVSASLGFPSPTAPSSLAGGICNAWPDAATCTTADCHANHFGMDGVTSNGSKACCPRRRRHLHCVLRRRHVPGSPLRR